MMKLEELYNDVICQYRPNYDMLNILAYITDFCNYNCWYCYNKKPKEKLHLNLDILSDYVIKLKDVTKRCIDLDLIGGEPSIHPDLIQFCEKLYGMTNINIYTNFSKSDDFYQKLEKLDIKFDISYHNINGKKNQSVIDRIYKTDSKNIRGVTIMIDKNSFDDDIEIFYQLQNDLKNIDVDFQPVIIGDQIDTYSQKQIDILDSISEEDTCKVFKIKLKNGDEMDVSHNQIYQITKQKYKRWLCNAGLDLMYIHVDGNIYNCDGYFYAKMKPVGNIYSNVLYMPNKKTLCDVENCPFQDNVRKIKVFKS